jgi:hypothetical protein
LDLTGRSRPAAALNSESLNPESPSFEPNLTFSTHINFNFYIDIYILTDYIDHRERIQEFKIGLLHFG